jgi:1-aminocyclopropane-1-carboxylate deaminase/D-cysteine desulfhydrase-like pyridoxal-dependent ACC family enzyme
MTGAANNPLFSWLPESSGTLPWVGLGDWPTPVLRLTPPAGSRGELWVKRDDLSSSIYGGNKVRKLEYLLGDALRQDAGRLITTGVVGSHHCLATAVHGRRVGLPTSLILFPQPITSHATEMARLNRAWADEVRECSTFAIQPFVEAALRWRRRADEPYVIPGGGSSSLGTLGYVTAALELAEQVRTRQLPRPDTITVAAGTLGTVAGLAIGVAMTDVADRIVAVRIVPSVVANLWTLSRLVEGASRLLGDAGATLPDPRAVVDRVEMVDDFFGPGYGQPTEAGARATAWFARQGLALDPSYTAKTAAALLDRLGPGPNGTTEPGGVHLYWHTLSSVTPPSPEQTEILPVIS